MGTTHIALTLANYLCSKQGMKTAYIELNATNQICALSQKQGNSVFSYKGIVFYPNISVTSLPEILHKNYQYYILDMGVLNTYTVTEFLRSDKPFLICSQSKWRFAHINEKIEHLFQYEQKKNCIRLIMNLSEQESNFPHFSSFCEQFPFPYIPNPFRLEPKNFHAISRLLKNF